MKLGVSYNVFSNGVELLPYMIKPIRPFVDFILINYQKVNYYGTKQIKQDDLNLINDLLRQKIVDKINCFEITNYAKTELEASQIEAQKRNQGKLLCKEAGCTHFLDLDCDETFKPDEFLKAKKYIMDHNISYSICEYVNFYKWATIQGVRNPKQPRYSPFICKITDNFEVKGGHEYCTKMVDGKTCSVDKSRGYNNTDAIPYLFPHNQIQMMHMNFIRKNLREKWEAHPQQLESITKNIDFLVRQIEGLNRNNLKLHPKFCELLYLGKVDLVEVSNYFNIPVKL